MLIGRRAGRYQPQGCSDQQAVPKGGWWWLGTGVPVSQPPTHPSTGSAITHSPCARRGCSDTNILHFYGMLRADTEHPTVSLGL